MDLTPLGLEVGIKPGEKTNIYGTDENALIMFRDTVENAVCAPIGCGDFFLATSLAYPFSRSERSATTATTAGIRTAK